MSEDSNLIWIIVFVLLLGCMYFAAVETAFASLSRSRIKAMADHGDKRAVKALYVYDHMDLAITTILICTNIVHLAAASLVAVYVTERFGEAYVTISTVISTLVIFFFGEMLPKSLAREFCTPISLKTGSTLSVLMFILRPVAALLSAIGNLASRLTGGEPEVTVTEDDIINIIEDMTEEGSIDEVQGDLISSALQFGDVTVESIVTSRMDLDALNIALPPKEILERVHASSHNRLPVYEETIDHIVGILQCRQFMKYYHESGEDLDIRKIITPPLFAHQSTLIQDVLHSMTEQKQQIAVITDNYGGTLGIVTIEDILEELVGELWDEDDKVYQNIVPLGNDSYSVNAEERVLDVFDEIDIHYRSEEAEELKNKLISEFVYEQCPDMPEEGDHFTFLDAEFTVLSMKRSRIYRVKIRKIPQENKKRGGRHA